MNANVNQTLIALQRDELLKPLPSWLVDYVEWHTKIRSDPEAVLDTPLLVLSIEHTNSGGLADRLRSLPYFVWEASRTKRLLLMRWDKNHPYSLEEFLIPPLGGIDWTVPTELEQKLVDPEYGTWYTFDHGDGKKSPLLMEDSTHEITITSKDGKQTSQVVKITDTPVIRTQHSVWTFHVGMKELSTRFGVKSPASPIFSRIFRLLLAPSPPVQKMLDKTLDRLGLSPGKYDAAHLRARYPGKPDLPKEAAQWTQEMRGNIRKAAAHSIVCASEATSITHSSRSNYLNAENSQMPVFFASDTNEAVRMMTRDSTSVVGFVTPLEKFHLDQNEKKGMIPKVPPSAYYPVFVDLWILSMARCLSIGEGNFGLTASMIGGIRCVVSHQSNSFDDINKMLKTCPEEIQMSA